jgi:hypothetical protein
MPELYKQYDHDQNEKHKKMREGMREIKGHTAPLDPF